MLFLIKEIDWEVNKFNVFIFGKYGVYMFCIYIYWVILVVVEKIEIILLVL